MKLPEDLHIEIIEKEDKVIISQQSISRKKLFTQKEMWKIAKQFHPDKIIITVVYRVNPDIIDLAYIEDKMQSLRIKRKDFIKQLAFEKERLSSILNGRTGPTLTE